MIIIIPSTNADVENSQGVIIIMIMIYCKIFTSVFVDGLLLESERQQVLEIGVRRETLQTTTLRSARILRRVLNTCEGLLSLKLQ